eukprot:5799864-Prymnesium_polylepis.1
MARARSPTPITAYAGVHPRDPQRLSWLAIPSGANAVHVRLPNTRDDGFGPQHIYICGCPVEGTFLRIPA